MKAKIDGLKKYKLIYCGELFIIALVLVVLGFLFAFKVIQVSEWKKWFFTILTLIGGIWVVIDFVWTLSSKAKRERNSLIDKIILFPEGLSLIILDIYALIKLIQDPSWNYIGEINFFQVLITCSIFYVAIAYLFEAIYHYFFKIHPMVYQLMEEDKKEQEENKEENKNED